MIDSLFQVFTCSSSAIDTKQKFSTRYSLSKTVNFLDGKNPDEPIHSKQKNVKLFLNIVSPRVNMSYISIIQCEHFCGLMGE